MQLLLLEVPSPVIMARYLVRGIDFQLIMIVHGNMGEGWWYLYIDGVCTVNSNLNGIVSVLILEVIAQFTGQN